MPLSKELKLFNYYVIERRGYLCISIILLILILYSNLIDYVLTRSLSIETEAVGVNIEYLDYTPVVYDDIEKVVEDDTPAITEYVKEEVELNYLFENIGYINVNTQLNIREYPNRDSEILDTLNWMDEVEYSVVNDDWCCIKLSDGTKGYIASKYIVSEKETYTKTYDVSGDKSKTYMDYRTITLKSSDQYKLQQRASTNLENGLRMLRNRYMVAVGSYFGCKVGQFIDVVLADGEVLPCIVGDAKQDIHTDNQNLHGLNGDTVEFIVNETILKDTTDVVGNISDVSEVFDGKVVQIRKYDHIEH